MDDSDDERSLEHMRDCGRTASVLALVALPDAAGLFVVPVATGAGAWFVRGYALLVLRSTYALVGASDMARSFAYPERLEAPAVTMLFGGILCLLVAVAAQTASGGSHELLEEMLRRAAGG